MARETVHITELDTGTLMTLSMTPESLTCTCKTRYQTYNLIGIGEAKVPRGDIPTEFSWSGILPGEKLKDASYVETGYWQDPKTIQSIWSSWRVSGKRLRLMVTGTTINHDVTLDNYTVDFTGGTGSSSYTISFNVDRDLRVYTVGEKGIASGAQAGGQTRPAMAAAGTYTVKSGDTLWAIAEAKLGNGSKYMQIYEMNKGVIGSDPRIIKPGQVLTLPG